MIRRVVPALDEATGGGKTDWDWRSYVKEQKGKLPPVNAFYQQEPAPSNKFKVGQLILATDHKSFLKCLSKVTNVGGCWIQYHLEGLDDTHYYWIACDDEGIAPLQPEEGKNMGAYPPTGMDADMFSRWIKKQLAKGEIADPSIFYTISKKWRPRKNMFVEGMRLLAYDKGNNFNCILYPATVVKVDKDKIKLNFDGWPSGCDITVPYDSRCIYSFEYAEKAKIPFAPPYFPQESRSGYSRMIGAIEPLIKTEAEDDGYENAEVNTPGEPEEPEEPERKFIQKRRHQTGLLEVITPKRRNVSYKETRTAQREQETGLTEKVDSILREAAKEFEKKKQVTQLQTKRRTQRIKNDSENGEEDEELLDSLKPGTSSISKSQGRQAVGKTIARQQQQVPQRKQQTPEKQQPTFLPQRVQQKATPVQSPQKTTQSPLSGQPLRLVGQPPTQPAQRLVGQPPTQPAIRRVQCLPVQHRSHATPSRSSPPQRLPPGVPQDPEHSGANVAPVQPRLAQAAHVASDTTIPFQKQPQASSRRKQAHPQQQKDAHQSPSPTTSVTLSPPQSTPPPAQKSSGSITSVVHTSSTYNPPTSNGTESRTASSSSASTPRSFTASITTKPLDTSKLLATKPVLSTPTTLQTVNLPQASSSSSVPLQIVNPKGYKLVPANTTPQRVQTSDGPQELIPVQFASTSSDSSQPLMLAMPANQQVLTSASLIPCMLNGQLVHLVQEVQIVQPPNNTSYTVVNNNALQQQTGNQLQTFQVAQAPSVPLVVVPQNDRSEPVQLLRETNVTTRYQHSGQGRLQTTRQPDQQRMTWDDLVQQRGTNMIFTEELFGSGSSLERIHPPPIRYPDAPILTKHPKTSQQAQEALRNMQQAGKRPVVPSKQPSSSRTSQVSIPQQQRQKNQSTEDEMQVIEERQRQSKQGKMQVICEAHYVTEQQPRAKPSTEERQNINHQDTDNRSHHDEEIDNFTPEAHGFTAEVESHNQPEQEGSSNSSSRRDSSSPKKKRRRIGDIVESILSAGISEEQLQMIIYEKKKENIAKAKAAAAAASTTTEHSGPSFSGNTARLVDIGPIEERESSTNSQPSLQTTQSPSVSPQSGTTSCKKTTAFTLQATSAQQTVPLQISVLDTTAKKRPSMAAQTPESSKASRSKNTSYQSRDTPTQSFLQSQEFVKSRESPNNHYISGSRETQEYQNTIITAGKLACSSPLPSPQNGSQSSTKLSYTCSQQYHFINRTRPTATAANQKHPGRPTASIDTIT